MKVLFLRSNPVDPDSRVEKEVNSLIKRGYKVEVFGWDRSADYSLREERLELPDGTAKVYRVGIKSQYGGGVKKNLFQMIRFQRQIRRFIKSCGEAYDVIHACDLDTGFTALTSSTRKVKFVYDIFDYYADAFAIPKKLRTVIETVERWVIDRADATIICTEERKQQISKSNPKALYVIHNSPAAFDVNHYFSVKGTCGKIRIVYVGILGSGRKIIELCEFVARNSEFELHIGGFGMLEDQIREFEKNNSNIFFYGKIPYSSVLALEAQCDIVTALYNPKPRNHQLAAPNKFYEALYMGKPVLMAKGTGMSYIVEDNDIGAVVPFDEFENGLLAIAKRRTDWPGMAIRAKAKYETEFSWTEMERRLYRLYDTLGREE